MELTKYIKDKTLLIVPNIQKAKILEKLDSLDTLTNIKIMSIEEFKKRFYFDYNKETLIYLTKKYQIKLDIAKIYLENMYCLSEIDTSSDKLNELKNIKTDLQAQNLLKTDSLFTKSLPSFKILFYGYDFYTKEQEKMIEELKKITEVEIVTPAEHSPKQLTAIEFNKIEDEVEYVINKIIELLKQGVNINQIKIVNPTCEYQEVLIKMSKFYNLPIQLKSKVSLYQTTFGKKAILYLKEGHNFNEVLLLLEEEYQDDIDLLNQLTNIFNQYIFYKEEKINIIEFIIDDMKHTFIKEEDKTEQIEMISLLHNQIDPNFHIFILGFNNDNYPTIYKDEDFISDELKTKLNMTTSLQMNKLAKQALMNKLFFIDNLTITYKLKTYFEEYYPSTLIKDYNMKVIKGYQNLSNIHYSKLYDEIKLTIMLDKYVQFASKEENLEKYYTTLKIPYASYNNTYQKINTSDLYDYLDNKLTLSYSAIDNFYHCKFRYFLTNILKIRKYEPSLAQNIGNVFHVILSKCLENNFDFDKEYEVESQKYITTAKEQFYFSKLKKELEFIIQTIKKQNLVLGFNKSYYEEIIYVSLEARVKTTFMGIIDKILMIEDNQMPLLSIIDYKTGSTSLDLTMTIHGLSLQLPVYMYLVKNSPKFKNAKVCGIYLQKILNTVKINTEDLKTTKEDSLKLQGYSIDEEYLLEKFDPTYEDSKVIKSLKKGKNGWYHYAKLLNEKQIEQLTNLTRKKIKQASIDILDADFSINPKRIDNKNIGCEFCSFHDICYQKEKDIIDLKSYKDLSFLEENN